MNHYIHAIGRQGRGKSRTDRLLERIERLEDEVGIEPPKTRTEKKLEELEEKIDRLLTEDAMGSWPEEDEETEEEERELEVKEEFKGMSGDEIIDLIREKNTLKDPEEIDADPSNTEVQLEPGKGEGRCKHCGEIFDNRGLQSHEPTCDEQNSEPQDVDDSTDLERQAKMLREDLNNNSREIVDRLSNTNYKASTMIAKGFEHLDQQDVRYIFSKLKDLGIAESRTAKGSRLTDLGQAVKEAEVTHPEFTEEEQLDADDLEMSERRQSIIQELEDSYKPLTRKELARRLYKIPSDVEIGTGDPYYNRIEAALSKLVKEDLVEKSRERKATASSAYQLSDKAIEQAQEESQGSSKEHSVSEAFEWENVKSEAGVNDQDIEIVKLVFLNLVEDEGVEEISYHDFEQRYSGEERPLRMFQKLFQNPKLLEGVRQRVCKDKSFKWKKRGESSTGTGAKNWVIKVE